ncbi:MAG: 2-hydroxymuconate tautomerase [Candidatus Latescibacterota bacterium]|nr:2-hydroxymuconate tautomerase [Candidatus Latescibacterota bacterium]
MPFVNVKMLEGRTHDQKQALVRAITEAMVDTCAAEPDGIMVVIEDIARDHWGRNGELLSEQ